ncbi:MAG: hypothetical protein ACYC4E_00180 [Carboxydocellales bacterium]
MIQSSGIQITTEGCVIATTAGRQLNRMEVGEMEGIELFIKLRDACDAVVKAYESDDAEAIQNSLGRFMLLMIQLDAIK